jgi:hypothetical protein
VNISLEHRQSKELWPFRPLGEMVQVDQQTE